MVARDPDRIVRSLEQLRRQFGLAPPDELDMVVRRWPELVGAAQAAVSRPVGLREGVLSVATSEPAVLEALRWSEARLVAALAEGPDPVAVVAVRGVLRGLGEP